MSVFLTVWTKTRQTVREVIDNRSLAFAIMLYAIGGIGSMMMGLMDSDFELEPFTLLLICIIGGPIMLLLMQFVVAGVILVFGKLFKGTATYKELYKALSVGYIPFIILIPFFTMWIASDPDSLLSSTVEPTGAIPTITVFVMLIMSIYSLVIQIVAVSEANNFSKWRAFFTLIIPGIIIFIIVFVILIAIVALVVGVANI